MYLQNFFILHLWNYVPIKQLIIPLFSQTLGTTILFSVSMDLTSLGISYKSYTFFFFFSLFFWPHYVACGILVPWPENLNPCPLQWKHRRLTTGPLGKFLIQVKSYLSFCDWLILVSLMSSSFICVIACVRISFFLFFTRYTLRQIMHIALCTLYHVILTMALWGKY